MTTAAGSRYDPLASAGGGGPQGPEPRIRLASPITGPEELAAVEAVLASGVLTNGPWTRRFEAAMAERHGTDHAVAFANGTVALAGMLLAAGIGPGDEVVVPSLTFIATATAVLHVGATPVFADVEPDTLNLDVADAERRITDRTRAVVPVHYAGQPVDLPAFADLAAAHGILLLEDAAQAHGATCAGRPAGSWGAAAMFSFTPTKNVTTGEGAVVTSSDEELVHRMRLLRNHGMSQPYRHDVLGYNWRLSELQSAVGTCQLDRLDAILAAKAANATAMAELLAAVPGVEPLAVRADRVHPFMLYTVRIAGGRRDAVAAALAEAGIESRVYFPPAHRQPIFAGSPDPVLPVTDEVAADILSLPFHLRLTDDDRREIARVVAAAS
ncbi:MAG TPA: DegT/DnrJ/EryC1/StrS family aminotransferase [Aquihabitans sp.]|nr:DegT/DnrJ/EryC1/StrS family aminotransferase [Aquihabitans sp.]